MIWELKECATVVDSGPCTFVPYFIFACIRICCFKSSVALLFWLFLVCVACCFRSFYRACMPFFCSSLCKSYWIRLGEGGTRSDLPDIVSLRFSY